MATDKTTATKTISVSPKARLMQEYRNDIRKKLKNDLKLQNIYEVPEITKIVVAVGLGRAKDDKRAFELALNTLRKITGQEPMQTIAKQSIAGFKLREGQKVGAKVTLRGDRMYEFLDRLINIVLPRVRDFRGVKNKGFDPQGNYNLGIVEQSVFPELNFDDVALLHGLQINIVIKNGTPDTSKALLSAFGMPFEKKGDQ